MESFLIQWPEEEHWRIAHSRLEGEGNIVVLELLKRGESREIFTEHVSMTTHLGATPENPDQVWKNLLRQTQDRYPEAKVRLLEENPDDNFPWGIYLVEGVPGENGYRSTLSHIVAGKEGMYMNAVILPQKAIDQAPLVRWLSIFKGGKVVPRTLQETLMSSGLQDLVLPQKQKENPQSDQEAPPFWLTDPHIRAFSHPRQPQDVPVMLVKKGIAEMIWVKVLTKNEHFYTGMTLGFGDHAENEKTIFMAFDPGVKRFVQIPPRAVSEGNRWEVRPCANCGFGTIYEFPHNRYEAFALPCPVCRGELQISPVSREFP